LLAYQRRKSAVFIDRNLLDFIFANHWQEATFFNLINLQRIFKNQTT